MAAKRFKSGNQELRKRKAKMKNVVRQVLPAFTTFPHEP
jgi:hypothetical protein